MQMNVIPGEDYALLLSERVSKERETIAARWLERLTGMLVLTKNAFPSDLLLDHIRC